MNHFPHANIEALINREFVYMNHTKNALNDLMHPRKNFHQNPFVTVSREPGSGGKLIAKKLAKRLGFNFYDKEIIDTLLGEFKKNHEEFKEEYAREFDEKEVNMTEELIQNIIFPNLITQNHFVEHLVKCITAITLKGKCVVLGRGANFFTDHRFGFHVRVTAPFNFRIQKTIKYEHLSKDKATERVEESSHEREKFVEKYFSKHIDNSEFYDLVLNRAYYSIDECVEIILNAFRKKMKLY